MEYYVRTGDRAARQRMIEVLERDGFLPERISHQDLLESSLPLTIDLVGKRYGMMGNVTCAAAAATQGRIIDIDEFYRIYRGEK